MIQTRKAKYLVASIVCVCVAGGAAAFMLWEVERKGDLLKETIQIIENEKQTEKEYLFLQEMLEDTADDRNHLATYILEGEDAAGFLSEIDSAAAQLGIELTTNTLEIVNTEAENFELLDVQFTINGEEQSVLTMLQVFETLPYHGTVDSFKGVRSFDPATGIRTMKSSIRLRLSTTEK